ncbi:hypothetical protein VTI74DRAFT_7934 [Chaetomium olivicolor]
MAGFASDSDSSYGYDFTASDEELLLAIADRLSPVLPQSRPTPATLTRPATPATPVRRNTTLKSDSVNSARNAAQSTPFASQFDPDATLAIEETIAAIDDDDLTFDVSELDPHGTPIHGQGPAYAHEVIYNNQQPKNRNRRLSPSVSDDGDDLSSFVSKTKPRSLPTLLPGPDVRYPDLSRALSDAQQAAESPTQAKAEPKGPADENRSPLLRFRTFPMKPFSVSDLTAGSWCELQYFYTLTKLPGGRKTRTTAMKRGSDLHEKLEREVFAPVQIEITKKEDAFGLKIWNIIQGLRVLRDQGFTRELEVWGIVDGNVVNGVIDGLSYENPDPELQDDVLSSRGSRQTITNSQPYELSTPGDYEIFITDVKTRNSPTPPPQTQVRSAIIQLFLYHRFMSDMASGKLDYIRVFQRYGLNPDEAFSDSFMSQIGTIHEEVFAEADAETSSDFAFGNDFSTTGRDSPQGGFVSAPSSPSQLSFSSESLSEPNLKYRTLRSLLPLLKFELHLTFPHGAADLGKIVAVEYRYRGRDLPPVPTTANTNPDASTRPRPRYEPGSVICTNTFFVEPETLDLYLSETMRWWKGEREPRGVPLEEAAFKCRSCEFVEECEWRRNLDQEALRRVRRKKEKKVEEDREGEEGKGKGQEREKKKRGRRKKKKSSSAVVPEGTEDVHTVVYA